MYSHHFGLRSSTLATQRAMALLRAQNQDVYLVTTTTAPQSLPRNHKHLFGVHRCDQEGLYTSHVFCFKEELHAELIAKALQTHHSRHGDFPARDLSPSSSSSTGGFRCMDGLDAGGLDPSIELTHVEIQREKLSELLHRLRGTGIVVSLLTGAGSEATGRLLFKCRDVRTETTKRSVVENFVRCWNEGQTEHQDCCWLPLPLPKPDWPPMPSLLPALLPAPVHHIVGSNSFSSDRAATLLKGVLAAAFFKCLVAMEILALFVVSDYYGF